MTLAEVHVAEAQQGNRLLVGVVVLAGLILTALVIGVTLLWDADVGPKGEPSERWVRLRLAGPLLDGPQEDAFHFDPEQAPLTLPQITGALHAAAEDPAISGLLLHLDRPQVGLAQAQELRAALTALIDAGKECVVWSKTYENLSWYLASPCTEVTMHPGGVPFVVGLSMQTTYFAGTLEKLGLTPDYLRVGEYKSAVESYTQAGPSPEAEEMYTALLESLQDTMVADLAATGRWSEAEVLALLDDPPVTPGAALDRGLLDALTYSDELNARFEDVDTVSLRAYLGEVLKTWKGRPAVAIVHVEGTIIDGRSAGGGFGGSSAGDRTIVERLRELEDDEDVAAVVLRVDSPGGSALASDVIWRAVEELKRHKPVVASMGGMAASGGYYVAMAADRIVADPATLTGSIGVYGGKVALAGLFEKVGLTTWSVSGAPLAGVNSSVDPFTDVERAKLQERMDAFYVTFVDKAAKGRAMSFDELDAVARGRVWTGAMAVERGLVDELGGIEHAVAVAGELAGLEDPGRMFVPKPLDLLEWLEVVTQPTDAQARAAAEVLLGEDTAELLGHARALQRALDQDGFLAALPLHVTIR